MQPYYDYRGPAPQRPAPPPPARRQSMPEWAQIALVFAGAFIGGFVVWPMARPYFIPAAQQQAGPQQQLPPGYSPQRRAAR